MSEKRDHVGAIEMVQPLLSKTNFVWIKVTPVISDVGVSVHLMMVIKSVSLYHKLSLVKIEVNANL